MAGKKPAVGITLDVKPTSQLDLERRLSEGDPEPVLFKTVNPDESSLMADNEWGEDSDNAFVGTDPIYQNRANETDQPLQAEEGPDKDAEEAFFSSYEKGTEVRPELAERYGEVKKGADSVNGSAESGEAASGSAEEDSSGVGADAGDSTAQNTQDSGSSS